MQEIIKLLPALGISASMNICAGIYYNVKNLGQSFNFKKLIEGIIKALIVTWMFVGSAYCFDTIDLSSIGITPVIIMTSAIGLYVGKALKSLIKILGVNIKTN